jgi:putative cardiolipin synthase
MTALGIARFLLYNFVMPHRRPWLKIFGLSLLALGLAWLVLRQAATLPSLEGRTPSSAFTDTAGTRLGQAIAGEAAAHPGMSGIQPLTEARDAFAARVLLARAAERSLDLQYYIWHNDLTGGLLFDEVRAAAERGVRVRLLLDDNNTPGLDSLLAALDSHPNIEVRLFNPFVIRKPRLLNFLVDFFRLNRRMHNKSFTADAQATIVGGRNIGDEYFGAGGGALFLDLDVLAAGPIAQDTAKDFDRYWASASSYPAPRILAPAPEGFLAASAGRAAAIARDPKARDYLDAIRRLPFIKDLLERRLALDWVPVRLISDDPAKALGRALPSELLISKLDDLLERPSQSLDVVSGYFVPTHTGTEIFTGLAARGVAVGILTNSLEATDVPLVHAGYAPHRKPLLEAGVKLWELKGMGGAGLSREVTGAGSTGGSAGGSGTALHAKTFAADKTRAFIGSYNFDPRSAQLNTELGFVIQSARLAAGIEQAFATTIPQSAYELKLTEQGQIVWIERRGAQVIRHDTEPGTTLWRRAIVAVLALLPIDWLL